MGYGAIAMSMGECFWLSESRLGESGAWSSGAEMSTLGMALVNTGSGAPGAVLEPAALAISGTAITSLSFLRYFSLSLSALSRSLLRPKIMALCLSTNRQSWAFCCDWECFSFKRYWITASGLPAVLTKLAISDVSGRLPPEPFLEFVLVAADMAESIEEVRGAPLAGSPRTAGVGPAMPGIGDLGRPTVCLENVAGSETLR